MIDLNLVAQDAMKEVISENLNEFDKNRWYLNTYKTKYPFKNEEELKVLSNSQYVESINDWVESVHGKGMEKLCVKLGIQYPIPVSFQAERLGRGLEDIVSKHVYDHVYLPKKEMEEKLSLESEKEM